MNTSIISSPSNSLPNELIIKLVYYLDEKTISVFTTTCKYVKEFNFGKLLIAYKIMHEYRQSFYVNNHNVLTWFAETLNHCYYNNSVKHYIQDLIDICDKISIYNVKHRIKTATSILYSNSSTNRHQCIRHPINRDTHQFRIDGRPTDRRYIKTKLHCILNINRFTYSYLRKKHFTVLALIY